GQDRLRLGRLEVLDVRVRELLEHVFVAGPLRRIAVATLLRKDAEGDASRPQDLEQRPERLLEIGVERARTPEPHQDVVPRRVERLESGGLDELGPLIVAEAPDVAA